MRDYNVSRLVEASLGQLEAVQNRLAQNERDLMREVALLREELSKEQDSTRMQIIQEMISVCPFLYAQGCRTLTERRIS